MKKLRIALIVIAVVIAAFQLTALDYGNLIWSNNASRYLGIIAMLCVIASMVLLIWQEGKRHPKQ